MKRFIHGFLQLLFDFFWFLAVFVFGWGYQAHIELNKFYVRQKETIVSLYKRAIYKELRFFFS